MASVSRLENLWKQFCKYIPKTVVVTSVLGVKKEKEEELK